MGPNFKSFMDQYMLIKLSEEAPSINPKYTRLAKNTAAFSAGYGIGMLGSVILGDKVLPKVLPMLSPKQRTVLANGAMLLAGASAALPIASAARTWKQAKMEEKEWRRKKERK